MAFSNNEEVKVVSEVKLVDVIISDNLKWENNTRNIANKAMRKIWVLRKLKQMKMSNEFIISWREALSSTGRLVTGGGTEVRRRRKQN